MTGYSEFENRYNLFSATTWALKKALEDDDRRPVLSGVMISSADGEIEQTEGKVPIYTARDERSFVEYETPSVVIFQPHPVPIRDLISNVKHYRKYNYEEGTVWEFEEPVPVRARFLIHVATRNPDNDAVLTSWMTRKMHSLTGLDVPIAENIEEYDRVTLYWHDPEEMDSDDVSKIREFQIDARTYLELIDGRKVKLTQMATQLTMADASSSSLSTLSAKTAFNVDSDSTEVMVNGALDGWPTSGSAEFEDGDVFTYSNRSKRELKQVSGIDNFHHFDSTISYSG